MAHGRLVTLILTGWLLAAGAVQALQVTDDRGLTVTFARTPQRIVSLLPSLTESVCALGQCRRLVGVDRYSNYPESVQALPQVGGGLDPNLEAVIALKPDVVLMATSAPVGERLQSLGIKVLALEPKTHADVRRVLEVIGRLLEVNDAARVWRGIEAGVLTAVRSLPPGADKTRVYFEVNIVPGNLGPFPKLNPEFVVRANPDVIMVGDRSYAGLQGRPGWSGIRAIREGQVCVFTAAQADVVVRPGPRMAEGAQIMARCLLGSGS
jgi:iron complex transport system substrate-binding protein